MEEPDWANPGEGVKKIPPAIPVAINIFLNMAAGFLRKLT